MFSVPLRRQIIVVLAVLFVSNTSVTAHAQVTLEVILRGSVSEITPAFAEAQGAIDEFRQGNVGESQKLLQSLKKKQPQLAPANVMYAKLAIAFQRVDIGRAALEQAVVDEPTDPEAFVIMGNLAFREKQLTFAQLSFSYASLVLADYDRNAMRKKDLAIRIAAGQAAVAESRRQWATARTQLLAWLKLQPEAEPALLQLAVVQFRLKDYQAATKSFEKARELNPKLQSALLYMGALYSEAGMSEEAQAAMEQAAKQGSDDLATLLTIGKWAIGTGDLELAQSLAEKAVELDDSSIPARLLLGGVLRTAKSYEAAEKELLAVLQEQPDNFSAINQLALTLIVQDDESSQRKALSYAKLNSKAHSDQKQSSGREAAVSLAWVLFRLGRETEAETVLKTIINTGALSDESAYFVARIFHDRGNVAAAETILKRTLSRTTAFAHRAEAKQLLDEIKSKPE